MLCEKCVHEEVCDQSSRQMWSTLAGEKECSDFKDRTKYVEVKHGRWVMTLYTTTSKRGRVIANKKFACSVCGYSNGRKQSNYCPNCGAKMDGDGDGDV